MESRFEPSEMNGATWTGCTAEDAAPPYGAVLGPLPWKFRLFSAASQASDPRGEDWRAHRFRASSLRKEFDWAAAYAALAGAHPAACVQFGFAPTGALADAPQGHILAAAN